MIETKVYVNRMHNGGALCSYQCRAAESPVVTGTFGVNQSVGLLFRPDTP